MYRRRMQVVCIMVLCVIGVSFAAAGAQPAGTVNDRSGSYDFGLIGDTRYTPEQQEKFLGLLAEMNQERSPSPSTMGTSRAAATRAPTTSTWRPARCSSSSMTR